MIYFLSYLTFSMLCFQYNPVQYNLSLKDSTSVDTIYINRGLSTQKLLLQKSDVDKNDIFEFIFPSIIALLVGLLAFLGTIHTGRKQRESSEKLLREQLKQSQKTLQKQIDSAQKIAELDFRKSVLSQNRQAWINTLRNVISRLVTIAKFSAVKGEISDENFFELQVLIAKAELLVNPDKDIEFVEAINDLEQTLYQIALNKKGLSELAYYEEKVRILAKTTLKNEWERVKKGE